MVLSISPWTAAGKSGPKPALSMIASLRIGIGPASDPGPVPATFQPINREDGVTDTDAKV